MARFLLLLFATSVAAMPSNWFAPLPPGGRIVGGQDALEGEFPYQLSMRRNGVHKCGAVIISEEWVVTAAHCALAFSTEATTFLAGTNKVNKGGSVHQAILKAVHEQYNASDLWRDDIAVIKVEPPFDFGTLVQPANLPQLRQEVPEGTLATVSGWGYDENWSLPVDLQKVEVPIVSDQKCDTLIGGGISENQLCAGYTEGQKDSCGGDSGGPLTVNGYLVGLVSWGSDYCGEPNYPGVYTQVSYFRDWIYNKTNI